MNFPLIVASFVISSVRLVENCDSDQMHRTYFATTYAVCMHMYFGLHTDRI